MIYVFSNCEVKINVTGIELIYLSTEYPLRQIYQNLSSMSNDDLVVMLPENLEPTHEYLIKIQRLYTGEHPIIAFTENDIGKSFSHLEEDKFHYDDTLMFRRGEMKSGLTDFSGFSPYNYIRERLIRLYNEGNFYVPNERRDPPPTKIKARRAMRISEHLTYESIINETVHADPMVVVDDIYKVKINLGIGDLLYARSTLDGMKDKFKKVIISPNIQVFSDNSRETHTQDLIFTKYLMDMLFKKPYYKIDSQNKNYPCRYAYTFHSIDKFPILKPNLSDTLCEGKPLDIGKYIVISTRIREIPKSEYNRDIKKNLMDALKQLSSKYKIVVIGERKLKNTREHNILKDRVFLIYNDIINAVNNKEQLVDLTFVSSSNDPNERLEKLKQDCLYMRDAEWNITLGNGGSFCMATAVGKVIGYYTPTNPIDATPFVFKEKQYPGIHVTDNLNVFFQKLNSLVEVKPIFRAKVNMGIGDLMLIRSMMDAVTDRYEKVHITPNTPFFDSLRTKDYKDSSIKEYMEMIFGNNSYYQLDTDLSYPQRNTETLFWNDNILFRGPQYLRDMFCVGEKLDIGPYITLTTKVRAINKNNYNGFKTRLMEALNNISSKYKIVILGERNLPNWPEYKNELANDVYCIYDDFINELDKNKIVDLSYDIHKTSKSPKTNKDIIKNMQQDCMYMKEAEYNITVGIGGGYCLTMVSGNIIGYWEHHKLPNVTELYKQWNGTKSNMYMTDDFDRFIYWIGEI